MAGYITKLLKKAVVGTNPQDRAMVFQTGAPLDDRFVVRDKAALISESAFTSIGYLYQGLVCTDESTGDVYVLTDAPSASNNFLKTDEWFEDKTDTAIKNEIERHWKKLAFAADVDNSLAALSGVFQFKGVASVINEAQDVLTTPSPLTLTHGNKTYDSVYCMATSYEFDGDLYYGWGTDTDGVLFWTAKPQVGRLVAQYVKGEAVEVTKVILKGKTYYKTEGTFPVLGNLQSWESIDGEVIYTTGEEGANAYSTSKESPESLLGEILTETFLAYDFTETLDKYETSLLGGGSSAVRADASTVGHVYQLGEYEYASNGHVWVKLGAPTETWTVLW